MNKVGSLMSTQEGVNFVANYLWTKFFVKWDRLWTNYMSEYNPIWNIDGKIVETETRDLEYNHNGTNTTSTSGTDTLSHSGSDTTSTSGTDTERKTGTSTTTHTGTDTTASDVYGFNSLSAVPSDVDTSTKNLTDTETDDLTNSFQHGKVETGSDTYTDSTQYGKRDTESRDLRDTDEGTIIRETVRQGNIGVTMTQTLLEADRDYWDNVKSLFYETVMLDMVNEITYKIYTPNI